MREITIFLVLVILIGSAKKHNSFIILIFSLLAILQHFLELVFGTYILPSIAIQWVVWTLPAAGLWHSDIFVSYIGFYSAWSKTGIILPKEWITHRELNILLSSSFVWMIIWNLFKLLKQVVTHSRIYRKLGQLRGLGHVGDLGDLEGQ